MTLTQILPIVSYYNGVMAATEMNLLRFGFVECVDLVAEVSNDGVVLLPEIGQGTLVV